MKTLLHINDTLLLKENKFVLILLMIFHFYTEVSFINNSCFFLAYPRHNFSEIKTKINRGNQWTTSVYMHIYWRHDHRIARTNKNRKKELKVTFPITERNTCLSKILCTLSYKLVKGLFFCMLSEKQEINDKLFNFWHCCLWQQSPCLYWYCFSYFLVTFPISTIYYFSKYVQKTC